MKIIDAYRYGVASPPVWKVWSVGHWADIHALGVQVFRGERVEIVEKGLFNQSMKSGPATLPPDLARIRPRR